MPKILEGAAARCPSETVPQALAAETRNALSAHILPTAATMVRVCMTVLSIGRLTHAGRLGIFIDKMLAFDGVIFLTSAVLSFAAIRIVVKNENVETWAEKLFLIGLTLCAVVAIVIAFAIDL